MHGALTTNEVAHLLERQGTLSTMAARDVRVREPAQRARLKKARSKASQRQTDRVGAVELIGSLELSTPDGTPITEEMVVAAVAEAFGLPWRRLDPLELNLQQVTSALSRPFVQRHDCLVIGERPDGALEVAVVEPRDRELFEGLRRVTGRAVVPILATRTDIQRIIREFYGFQHSIRAAEREYGDVRLGGDLERLFHLKAETELEATDQHIVAACDHLLRHAFEQGASDIHVEPRRAGARVRYRIDGVLHTMHQLPRPVVPPIVSRLKMMARMDIAERRRAQDGRIKSSHGDREVEMRVSVMPTVFGEKVVIRIFDPDVLLQDLDQLGFSQAQRTQWDALIRRTHGIILLTGPTGSGKTTTLYSSLKTVADEEVNVVTIEDPVEMVTDAFNQVAVDPRVDVTFANALRTVLRQDPDIIMVGEIRDLETARHAVQAALTGHLVFSTLHTNDAAGAFARLIDLGIEPFLVASTVIGVAAQRLARRICAKCGVHRLLPGDEARLLGVPVDDDTPLPVRQGAGCVECRNTGYKGRVGLFELMPVTATLRPLIHHAATSDQILQAARAEGMMTLREAALTKMLAGETTVDEVVRVTAMTETAIEEG
jgi:general secretion pathway protein E